MIQNLRMRTVKLLSRLIHPLVEEGVITVGEEQILLSNLKHLVKKGDLLPDMMPKLIDRTEAATMLGLGLSNFKKLESEHAFPFQRKMIGSSIRYRNTDILHYIMSQEEDAVMPA